MEDEQYDAISGYLGRGAYIQEIAKVCIKKMLQAGKWKALLQRPKSGWKRP